MGFNYHAISTTTMTGDGEHSTHKMVMTWGWFLWHRVYRIISIPLVYYAMYLAYMEVSYQNQPFTSVYHSKPCILGYHHLCNTPYIYPSEPSTGLVRNSEHAASHHHEPSGGANLRHETRLLREFEVSKVMKSRETNAIKLQFWRLTTTIHNLFSGHWGWFMPSCLPHLRDFN